MQLQEHQLKGIRLLNNKLAATIAKAGRASRGGSGGAGSDGDQISSGGAANVFDLNNVSIDFSNVANKAAQVLLGSDSHVDKTNNSSFKNDYNKNIKQSFKDFEM